MTRIRGSAGRRPRQEKLGELMERLELEALLLRRSTNFVWYRGGADNRVDHASPYGVADVLFTREGEYILTNDIEAPRMREEQTPGFEVIEHPWYRDEAAAIREVIGDVPLGTDFSLEGALDVSGEVGSLRYVLDAEALERYRKVVADAAAAVAEAAGSLEPETDEREAAANLAPAGRRRGLFSPVLLAAAGDRIARYRHPIPKGGFIERRALLVVSAERGGLYANVTRIVDFEEPERELRRRQENLRSHPRALKGRSHAARSHARRGLPRLPALLRGGRLRRRVDAPPSGGLTGYASREIIATPQTDQQIRVGQAFAWNPSITGAKAEETFVLTESGPEMITRLPEGGI